MLDVIGTARLAGTVVPVFKPGGLARSYTIVTATDEATGKFDKLKPIGLPGFFTASLDYPRARLSSSTSRRNSRNLPGLTRNQRAVASALDQAFNGDADTSARASQPSSGIPSGLDAALFGLTDAQLPAALDALSGEIYASEKSVLINQALFGRETLLARLRQSSVGSGMPEPRGKSGVGRGRRGSATGKRSTATTMRPMSAPAMAVSSAVPISTPATTGTSGWLSATGNPAPTSAIWRARRRRNPAWSGPMPAQASAPGSSGPGAPTA